MRSSQCQRTARQHRTLDVGAEADQVGGGVPVVHADNVLLDDRALIQVLGDVVSGGADQLDATILRLLERAGADEGGQERVVDVDQGASRVAEERPGRWNSVRWKKAPPSVTMLAPASVRKVLMADTMPGRSRQRMRSRPWSVLCSEAGAALIRGSRISPVQW
jgi:hypothetical protein